MDVGTVLSAAQTLFAALQCAELKEFLSIFGYKSQLDGLKDTVELITAVLRDAEAKQELSQREQHLIEKLKDAVFEADDLFDEFATLAEQKQLLEAYGSVSKKVSNFFAPSKNRLSLAVRMSRGVKDIKKKLDAIAYNKQFDLKIDPEPITKMSRETSSRVDKFEIIGREQDVEEIVGTLLDHPNDQRDVSVISIVGIGGLGKTALAQLVYNDPRVTDAFQLKMWHCVSDEDQKQLDVKNILAKLLEKNLEGSTMEQVQSEYRAHIAGEKFLLILDDVWTEKDDQWGELVKYMIGEKRGSWILVTTRSKKTATITRGLIHELSGLSKEDSWCLFEKRAFSLDKPKATDELVEIGQKIVDKCGGVPLAIRVVGSLLCGQAKSKWLSVQKNRLVNKTDYNDGIMPILKLSFNQLEAPLKNCFRYCALFPKDYVIQKQMLINLWMAQGYIIPLDENQSIDEAAEDYFSILLKRCFFQDIKENKMGEIKSCKMHDLMHDIAQNVSGKEICAFDSRIEGNVNVNVLHLSICNMSEYEKYYSSGKTHIRSLLFFYCNYNYQLEVKALVKRFKCLRMLDLSHKKMEYLPDSIGELLHLRYLDLSYNEKMEVISNSVTKLCNLETLILQGCKALKELPKDFGRLVKLRFLNIKGCGELMCMPRSMGKLTCLHTLKGGYRMIDEGERCTSWKQWLDGLENLKTLTNLRGQLQIVISWPKNAKNDVKEDRREGFYLRNMEHLNTLDLLLGYDLEADSDDEDGGIRMEKDEGIRMRVMEDLQPPSNLKKLKVWRCYGVKTFGWLTATLPPHLVELHVEDCKELEYLPCLGNLLHLKVLQLENLLNLEYIEEEDSMMSASTKASLFPLSLEKLDLCYLPKFQGWRRVGGCLENSAVNNSSDLSQLKKLMINKCPDLICILVCPMLETLYLGRFNEKLQIKTDERLSEAGNEEDVVPRLREVEIDNAAWLNTMPMESFHSLQFLTIDDDDEMEDLPACMQYMSTLVRLEIYKCSKLKAMPNWMPKLTSLQILYIDKCSESLEKRCQKDPPGEDMPYIQHIPYISRSGLL